VWSVADDAAPPRVLGKPVKFNLTHHNLYTIRADPNANTRSGSALVEGRLSTLGGEGKRNSTARNSVGELVMVESVVFKKLQTRTPQGWLNNVPKAIPSVLHEIMCTPATDTVGQVLRCEKRATVFAGVAADVSFCTQKNQFMSSAVADFCEQSMWLYVKKLDKLAFTREEQRNEADNGTMKGSISAGELQRRKDKGDNIDLFALVLFFITDMHSWPLLRGL
jgi:hypothetical protein